MVGSRSAPMRAPPRPKFSARYQDIEADRRWGTISVLIHTQGMGIGSARTVTIFRDDAF
jgi:hypothetical protein